MSAWNPAMAISRAVSQIELPLRSTVSPSPSLRSTPCRSWGLAVARIRGLLPIPTSLHRSGTVVPTADSVWLRRGSVGAFVQPWTSRSSPQLRPAPLGSCPGSCGFVQRRPRPGACRSSTILRLQTSPGQHQNPYASHWRRIADLQTCGSHESG